jgi:type IV pilus assembly protein PilA
MGRFSKTLAKMMRGKQKGFTLIELLIVVAILGILAAVIIPNVATFMTTGKLNAARTEAENVKTGALAYFADHGGLSGAVNNGWPSTSDDLVNGAYVSAAPIADYTFSNSGNITGATYPGSPALFNWDSATQTWIKP